MYGRLLFAQALDLLHRHEQPRTLVRKFLKLVAKIAAVVLIDQRHPVESLPSFPGYTLQLLSALLLAAITLLSCSEPARDFVRVGVDVDAGSLDPRLMRDTTAYRVVNLLYDGLVALDASLNPTPALAHHWDHPDDTTWIFYLRDDARFHDGTPVTAHDVVYTFETILDPSFGAPLRSLYAPITKIEATDEHTVIFTLSAAYAPLLTYLELGIVPRGQEAITGNGPYRLSLWDRGAKIVLVAHDDYWGGAPSIPRLELLVVPDNTARAQAFEAGDLDLIQSPLAPNDIRRLSEDPRFESFTSDAPAITYLNFNTASAPLDDPSLRKALSMLVNQETILAAIYEGTDRGASSILLPSSWSFSNDVRQPPHDADAAAELLDELGWRDRDGDGLRERDGEPLALELGTHSEDLNRVQTVEFLQNSFQKHGIDATIRISDWPSFSVRRGRLRHHSARVDAARRSRPRELRPAAHGRRSQLGAIYEPSSRRSSRERP